MGWKNSEKQWLEDDGLLVLRKAGTEWQEESS